MVKVFYLNSNNEGSLTHKGLMELKQIFSQVPNKNKVKVFSNFLNQLRSLGFKIDTSQLQRG